MVDFCRILFFVFVLRPLISFFMGLRIYGRSYLNLNHPFIIVANHSSHLDTAVLMSLFPNRELRKIRPVAASDYFERNQCVAGLSKVFFNILPIKRVNITAENNPLDIMKQALARKESLIIFPEGTRSLAKEMGEFRPGVAHLLKDFLDVPVVPVYLMNLGKAMPKGEFIIVPFICEVHVGQPFHPQGTKEEVMMSIRERIMDLKKEVQWQ